MELKKLSIKNFLEGKAASTLPAVRQQTDLARIANTLQREMFRFLGTGQPILIKDKSEIITQGYEMNADVRTVVDWVAKKVAAIDWIVYEVKDEKSSRDYQRYTKRYSIKNLERAETIRRKAYERVEIDEITKILDQPNEYQARQEFVFENVGFHLLTGFAGMFIVSPDNGPNKGVPIELHNLPTPLLTPISGGPMKPLAGFKLYYDANNSLPIKIEDLAFRRSTCFTHDINASHLMGMSPFYSGRNAIRRSNDISIADLKLLQNLGAIGMLTGQDTSQGLDADEAARLSELYQERFGGVYNYGKIITTGFNVKWQKMGVTAKELSLHESALDARRSICNLLNLPSQIFNDPSGQTYSNMEAARKAGFTDACIPQLESLRGCFNQAITNRLQGKYKNKKFFIDYDLASVSELQEDMKELTERMEKSWWIKGIDKQRASGYDEDTEAMDCYFIPQNLVRYDGDLKDLPVDEETMKMISEFQEKGKL